MMLLSDGSGLSRENPDSAPLSAIFLCKALPRHPGVLSHFGFQMNAVLGRLELKIARLPKF